MNLFSSSCSSLNDFLYSTVLVPSIAKSDQVGYSGRYKKYCVTVLCGVIKEPAFHGVLCSKASDHSEPARVPVVQAIQLERHDLVWSGALVRQTSSHEMCYTIAFNLSLDKNKPVALSMLAAFHEGEFNAVPLHERAFVQ